MPTNELGTVTLPPFITDPKRRTVNLPKISQTPEGAVPIPPPPTEQPQQHPILTSIFGSPDNQRAALPQAADKTLEFMRSSGPEQAAMLPGSVQKIGRGVAQGVRDVAESATTPEGLGTLIALTAATGFGPGIVVKLLKLGFTAAGIKGLADSAPAAVNAFMKGDDEEGSRQLFHTLVNAGMVPPGLKVAKGGALNALDALKSSEGFVGNLARDEGGYIRVDYFDRNNKPLGAEHISGPDVIHRVGDVHPTAFHDLPRGSKAVVSVRAEPIGGKGAETRMVGEQLIRHGIDETNVTYKIGEGPQAAVIPESEFHDRFGGWLKPGETTDISLPPSAAVEPEAGPSLGAQTSPGRAGVARTPSGRQSFKSPAYGVYPEFKPSEPYTPPAPAAPRPRQAEAPAQSSSDVLERTLAALVEQNTLMKQYIDALMQGRTPATPPPTEAAVPVPSTGAVPQAAKPAASLPQPGELEASMDQLLKTGLPKGEDLTAAEAGVSGGSKKKQPVSYVGKTQAEKYAPKEPAAQEAQVSSSSPEDFTAAVERSERNEGPPVFVVRRGLGSAPPTRGWVRRRILDQRGKPTNRYEFMPENYSGDPFSIPISDVEFTGAKTHTMAIPRFGKRTFNQGQEFAVPRAAKRTEQFILPRGGKGYKVGDHIMPADEASRMIEAYKAEGTPASLRSAKVLEDNQAPDGSVKFYQVIADEAAPTVQARHTSRTITKPEAPNSRLKSIVDTPEYRVAADVENSKEYIRRQRELGEDEESLRIQARKLGINKPQRAPKAQLYLPTQLEPVAKEVNTEGAVASRAIHEETQKSLTDIEQKMTAAGGERAKPEYKPEPGPPEPPPPVQRLVTKEEVKKEARVSKPTETYKGQRKQELALEEAARKRMEYKPGAVGEPVKPAPLPGSEPVKDKTAEDFRTRDLAITATSQKLIKLRARLAKVMGTPIGDRLTEEIKTLEKHLAALTPKKPSEAVPVPPPPKE